MWSRDVLIQRDWGGQKNVGDDSGARRWGPVPLGTSACMASVPL